MFSIVISLQTMAGASLRIKRVESADMNILWRLCVRVASPAIDQSVCTHIQI